ncbi:MAG: M1 family aminopeptidase [Candidatus Zixiibacteriota bacterium]
MKSVVLITSLMLFAGSIFPAYVANASDTVLSDHHSSQDDWDALFYRINLNLDFDNSAIDGSVYLEGRSLINGLSFIRLDLYRYDYDPFHYMHVDSVKVVGIANPTGTQVDSFVDISFQPQTYNYNDTFRVTVYYHGKPGYALTQLGFIFGAHARTDICYNMSEPVYARRWWPCKDRVEDKADSIYMTVTYPDNFRCASNGTLNMEFVSGGRETSYWREHYPIATYQVGIGCTNYVRLDTSYILQSGNGTMPIWFYVYPENVATARDSFPKVVEMLDTFETCFGAYPYSGIYPPYVMEKYGMMQVPIRLGAMEYPTITAICDTQYGQTPLSHELSHSWWGNCVTCSTWNHFWINEGFARYSECIWVEKNMV